MWLLARRKWLESNYLDAKTQRRSRAPGGLPCGVPPLLTSLGRALRLRCPRCGASGLFDSWLRPKRSCPTCGQPIERSEEGYYLGALLVNLLIAELLPLAGVVGVLLATWPHPPWDLLLYGGAALAIVSPFVFYPFSKLAWLAVDLYIQPTIDRT
jgi:uncharacterized protein (DUF983 family)